MEMIDFKPENVRTISHDTDLNVFTVPGDGYLVLIELIHPVLSVYGQFGKAYFRRVTTLFYLSVCIDT